MSCPSCPCNSMATASISLVTIFLRYAPVIILSPDNPLLMSLHQSAHQTKIVVAWPCHHFLMSSSFHWMICLSRPCSSTATAPICSVSTSLRHLLSSSSHWLTCASCPCTSKATAPISSPDLKCRGLALASFSHVLILPLHDVPLMSLHLYNNSTSQFSHYIFEACLS